MASAEDDFDKPQSSVLPNNAEPEESGDDSGSGKTVEKPSREDFGRMLYGCQHYRRRCKIRAPCCNEVFTCRHCHNEATFALSDPKERHEIVRQDIKQVICAVCSKEQEVAEFCSNCGVKFGDYFCKICNFFEDDTTKQQFHCHDCGICRVGGRENFFHCPKCGSCYSVGLLNNHSCVENSMKNHCPICYEFLFDSIKPARIMKCGHLMHLECFTQMVTQNQYRCPTCSKSLWDMSDYWLRLDQEIEATTMPEEYRYEVLILCNDCNKTCNASFHILGHKCMHCGSYNTRRLKTVEDDK